MQGDKGKSIASTSQPRQFTNYAQFNEQRFSQAGEYGSQKHKFQKAGKSGKDNQGQVTKVATVFQPKPVRKTLFLSQETEEVDGAETAV